MRGTLKYGTMKRCAFYVIFILRYRNGASIIMTRKIIEAGEEPDDLRKWKYIGLGGRG